MLGKMRANIAIFFGICIFLSGPLFFLIACSPRILSQSVSISPNSGPIGTLFSIFSGEIDLSIIQEVKVGAVTALRVSSSNTSLTYFLMPGSTSGVVNVITSAGDVIATTSDFTVTPTGFPVNQEGSKAFGSGAVGAAYQGTAVAMSADGATALVGGYSDNSNIGAVWVFIKRNGIWVQQGAKLVGANVIGSSAQGISVSLSADGNTAAVGGVNDNSNTGAVWIFTRNNEVWSEQSKLVGEGYIGAPQQGPASLSADGNTLLVGGSADNFGVGAVWVFTRSNGVWSQQGVKLVATDYVGSSAQGGAVSLSADGNTAIVGGLNDNSSIGAAWVFTRKDGIWNQEGNKLSGSDANGAAFQGKSVSLSADGNTALIGGYEDDSYIGAAWVFVRNESVWSQKGGKLVGAGYIGTPLQGSSVSMSADGSTLLIGGTNDDSNLGATWVFTRNEGSWNQQGSKLVGSGWSGNPVVQGTSVSVSADGKTVIIGGPFDNSNAGAAWFFGP